jgi:hypothetical protein
MPDPSFAENFGSSVSLFLVHLEFRENSSSIQGLPGELPSF